MSIFRLFSQAIILGLFLAACNSTSKSGERSEAANTESTHLADKPDPSRDSIVLFLLDASAKDFHDHQPPVPVDFRNLEVRNLVGSDGANHYMICGQFLGQDKQSQDDWTTFATIKTSGYEQWIGNQSIAYCQDSKPVKYTANDLTASLKSRFDSLQHLAK
jgi:hypothetical protein